MPLDAPRPAWTIPWIHPARLPRTGEWSSTRSSQESLMTVDADPLQIRQQLEQVTWQREDLESQCICLKQELLRVMEREAELKQFCAMEAERSKWETREDRLVEQMRQLEYRLARLEGQRKSGRDRLTTVVRKVASLPSWSNASCLDSERSQSSLMPQLPEATHKNACPVYAADGTTAKSYNQSDSVVKGATSTTGKSAGVLVQAQPQQFLQQLPPLSKFREQTEEGETFKDWLKQFEMVANVCGWSGPTKLAH